MGAPNLGVREQRILLHGLCTGVNEGTSSDDLGAMSVFSFTSIVAGLGL